MTFRVLRFLCLMCCLVVNTVLQAQDPCDNNPVLILGENLDVASGSTACIDFTVQDFDEILTMQFSIGFDPSVLQYDFVDFGSGNPLSLTQTDFGVDNSSGVLTLTWFDFITFAGITLSDNTTLFTLCFTAIGEPGDTSSLVFNNAITEIEVSATPVACIVEPILDAGTITIACNDLYISTSSCSTPLGTNGGAITFRVCGGDPAYNYMITPGAMSGNSGENEEIQINGLSPGVYQIDITDASGGTESANVTVASGANLTAALEVKNPTCEGREDGQVKIINVAGGQAPYIYEWSTGLYNRDSIFLLADGSYSVTVTDNEGCELILTEMIAADPIIVTATLIQGESCNEANDGIVEFEITGGTPNANGEYIINNMTRPATVQITGIPGGMFSYQVRDFAIPRCETEIEMIDVPVISNPTLMNNSLDVTCSGADDGFIEVVVQGSSVSNFRYDLLDAAGNPSTLTGFSILDTFRVENVPPGIYTVVAIERIMDGNGNIIDGCSTMVDVTIEDQEPLFFDVLTELDPGCSGDNGEISVTGAGGQSPYNFVWDDMSNGAMRTGLVPGTYFVTMTDAAMCVRDTMFVLSDSGGDLDITAGILQTISCTGDDNGSISVQVNASGNFDFMWSVVGQAGVISVNQTLTNLPAGEYAVVVDDPVQNCSAMDTVLLSEPEALSLEVSNFLTPECKDSPNGSLSVSPLGGISPYTYLWDDNSVSNVRPAIPSGTYCVTVTDNNLCTFDSCFVLDPPPPILLDVVTIGFAACNGEGSAQVEVLASGNNNPSFTNYGYILLEQDLTTVVLNVSGPASFIIDDVPAGTYFLVATDLICPSDPVEITVQEPDPLRFDPDADIISPSCFGLCDGTITGAALGGTSPYSYSWSVDPGPTPFIDNLCTGLVYVTITDANNCVQMDSVLLTEPDTLIASIDNFQTLDVSCENKTDGNIVIQHTGGNEGMPFAYTWTDDISSTSQANDLGVGTYEVTVTDARGCTDSLSYTLVSPPAVTGMVDTPEEPLCFGGTTCIGVSNVGGGQGAPYSFSIRKGPNLPIDSCVIVSAGEYFVQIFDVRGCGLDTTITIGQPSPLEVEFGTDVLEVELGDTSVVLTANISNPFPIDTIIWDPSESVECLDVDCSQITVAPIGTTIYQVTVTDENGCTDSDFIEVIVSTDRNVYVPNIFSPDNNGRNDRFALYFGQGVTEVLYFRIYDRWGNKIYEENDVSISENGQLLGWDGRFKGRDLDPAVFVYDSQVAFVDGRTVSYKGTFVLSR